MDNEDIIESESYGILAATTKSTDPLCSGLSAGPDTLATILRSQAEDFESWDEVRKLYLSLLSDGVSTEGKFDPPIWDLIENVRTNPIGEFTTKYTITQGSCSDSVNLTLKVVESLSDFDCSLSAGEDTILTITRAEADAISSWDEVRKLYLSMLDQGVPQDGEFDPSIWDIINAYGQSKIGNFTTTYKIEKGECSDSVDLTITVVEGPDSDPTCSLSAGNDNSRILTISEAEAIPSWDEVRKLYLSLLDPEVPRDGKFDPTIWDLINAYGEAKIGSFSTNYTVSDGTCSDSTELTIIVIADSSDPTCELSAGPDKAKTILLSEAVAIPSWDEVRKMFLNMLEPGVNRDGSFDPSIWDIINQFNTQGVGSYSTVYTIFEENCRDSVILTIHVVKE